jgi:hypothetical protein
MFDGPGFVHRAKRRLYKGYIGALERLDPDVAKHLLASQREMFLAGKAFFEEEAKHAEKAMNRMERRKDEHKTQIEVVER